MKVADLGIDPRLADALAQRGVTELWPSQLEAAPAAVAGESLLAAIPTASGKSLVAYLALLGRALEGRKGVYIVPLRALAGEKYEELKALAQPLGLRVGIGTGEYDTPGDRLGLNDIVVLTSEKADALLRLRTRWLEGAGCIVADEVHLIHDTSRGPTLEVLLTRFRSLDPDAQLLALSATVANAAEIADWLGARLVASEWRPVPLKEGVLFGSAVTFTDRSQRAVPGRGDEVERLVEDTVLEGAQCLVFVNTRKSAEAAAVRLGGLAAKHLSAHARAALEEAAAPLRESARSPVREKLGACIRDGAAFHHAGLDAPERALVERLFRERLLLALTATPTLAAGINLPSRRVIVRDMYRFDADIGTRSPIPVLEYKQMAGRAGRPRYDPYGEAITIAKTADEREELLFHYLMGRPEAVESKLAAEPALRVHALASIAMGYATTEQGLHEFFGSTLLARQHGADHVERALYGVMRFLEQEGFVTTEHGLRATPFGQRTSALYIDPASAIVLRDALGRMTDATPPLPILHAIAATPDMGKLYLRRADDWVEDRARELEADALVPPRHDAGTDWFVAEVKTALLLEAWMDEATDETMMSRFGAYPGDVRGRVDTAQWLLHAMRELAPQFNAEARAPLSGVILRVRHGVKEELLPLVRLDGVGRYRARMLHRAGLKDLAALKAATPGALASVRGIGAKTAAQIKAQLGQEVDPATIPVDVRPEAAVERTSAPAPRRTRTKKPKRDGPLSDFVRADTLLDEGRDAE